MKILSATLIAVLLLCGSPLLAEQPPREAGHFSVGRPSGNNTNVLVDMPPEVWTRGQRDRQINCLHCCLFGNQQYTEGAVIKNAGVLLQCVRDESSVGTHNLLWKIVRQQ